MLMPGVVGILLAVLCASCATSPTRTKARSMPGPKPAIVPTGPVPAAEMAPTPETATPTRPKLRPGHCEEGFDCVDTVGFPPDGYRWDCEEGKCSRVKLPSLGGEEPPPEDANSAPMAGKARAKSQRTRRQSN